MSDSVDLNMIRKYYVTSYLANIWRKFWLQLTFYQIILQD